MLRRFENSRFSGWWRCQVSPARLPPPPIPRQRPTPDGVPVSLPLVAVVGDDDDAGGRAGAMDDGLRAGGARRGEAAGEGAGHVEV